MLQTFLLLFGIISFAFGIIFSLMLANAEISSLFTQMVLPLSFLISLVSFGFYGVLNKLSEILKLTKNEEENNKKAGNYLWE